MRWRDTTRQAVQNLKQTPLRTFLTLVGVMIGVSALVGTVAFGLGMQKISTDQLEKLNVYNVITVYPSSLRAQGHESKKQPKVKPQSLDDTCIAKIRKLSGVSDVVPLIQFPLEIEIAGEKQAITGQGVSLASPTLSKRFPLEEGGRYPVAGKNEVVVSADLLDRFKMGRPKDIINRALTVFLATPSLAVSPNNASFPSLTMDRQPIRMTICGVRKKMEGALNGSPVNVDVLWNLETVRQYGIQRLVMLQSMVLSPGVTNMYTTVEVTMRDVRRIDAVEKEIHTMGLRSFSMASILKEMNTFFLIFDMVLGAIGSVGLLVAGIGIANTMLISVLERRHEIGIVKAVGASRSAIRNIFFVEASIIGLIGGVFGVGVGWTICRLVNTGINVYIQSQGGQSITFFFFPWWMIAAVVLFAMMLSMISALIPAVRAARMDPVVALRYE